MTGFAGSAGEAVIRPGLDRIRLALAFSDHPERSFRAFHVAGTNGKGSTSLFLESILRGLVPGPVGLYTSPHLVSPEERIRIDGRKIPRSELSRGFRKAERMSREIRRIAGEPLSWFESLTWTAFDWFRRNGVRTAILETGLGGRWDATNACLPVVSVVTRIAVDHRDWLGNTVRRIASEKAGIVRPEVPCVVGRLGTASRAVVRAAAREAGAPVWEMGPDFGWKAGRSGALTVELPGLIFGEVRLAAAARFQRDNAALACAAAWRFLRSSGVGGARFAEAARSALGTANPPGRFEPLPGVRNGRAWVDGAHNPDAARALARELGRVRSAGGPIVAVWSMLRDKDAGGFLRALRTSVDRWIVYPLRHDRAAPVGRLEAACRGAGVPFETARGFREAWSAARRSAGAGTVLVCGSLVAVGDAYRHRVGEVP